VTDRLQIVGGNRSLGRVWHFSSHKKCMSTVLIKASFLECCCLTKFVFSIFQKLKWNCFISVYYQFDFSFQYFKFKLNFISQILISKNSFFNRQQSRIVSNYMHILDSHDLLLPNRFYFNFFTPTGMTIAENWCWVTAISTFLFNQEE